MKETSWCMSALTSSKSWKNLLHSFQPQSPVPRDWWCEPGLDCHSIMLLSRGCWPRSLILFQVHFLMERRCWSAPCLRRRLIKGSFSARIALISIICPLAQISCDSRLLCSRNCAVSTLAMKGITWPSPVAPALCSRDHGPIPLRYSYTQCAIREAPTNIICSGSKL